MTQFILHSQGWIFAYIGANQDVEKVASSMGIRNSLCFEATPEGTKEMFKMESESRNELFCCMGEGIDARQLSEREYFKDTTVKNPEKTLEKKLEKKKNKWWPF